MKEQDRVKQQRWRAANPEKYRARRAQDQMARRERYWADAEYRERRKAAARARHHRRRDAGVTIHHVAPPEVFAELLSAQAGVCAICRRPETAKDPSGRIKRLAVDHDRATGSIRGLLCARCNTAIGLLMHDADRIQAAAEYLAHVAPDVARSAVASLDRRKA